MLIDGNDHKNITCSDRFKQKLNTFFLICKNAGKIVCFCKNNISDVADAAIIDLTILNLGFYQCVKTLISAEKNNTPFFMHRSLLQLLSRCSKYKIDD